MNRSQALKILQINGKNPSNDEIKKQYRILALKYHPDRYHIDDCEKFQEISNAYSFLTENKSHKMNYKEILINFLQSINIQDTLYEHIYSIISNRMDILYEKINDCDTEILIQVYRIIKKNSNMLGISDIILEKIKEYIIQKINSAVQITLRPKLDDLYKHNVYKLEYENNTYLIPLWHHELVYNHNKNDLYVKCEPELPDNICIDENNNILVNINIPLDGLLDMNDITFYICNKKITINKDKLNLKKNQTIVIEEIGIPKISQKNIYNVSKLSNVIVNVSISNF
jgi:hypothetical protein